MTLSKKERVYLENVLEAEKVDNIHIELSDLQLTKNQLWDLNYKLKNKFIKLHEDYWLLVNYFKSYNNYFSSRQTDKNSFVIETAKSQIHSNEIINKVKCYFCLRKESDLNSSIDITEINVCSECMNSVLGK